MLLEGERVRLKVIHNGGDNCIDARLEEEMKHCDIVILLFDIANKPTMEKLKTKVLKSCRVSGDLWVVDSTTTTTMAHIDSGIHLSEAGTDQRRSC